MLQFHTYILYSSKRDKYYIGSTGEDLQGRIRRHNSNHKGFTGGVGDWKLVFAETFGEKSAASKREKEIKGWKSRKKIERLMGLEHPYL